MSAALGLLRLQQIDSRITHIEARLAKIRETLENDADLRAAVEEVQSAEVQQHDSERARESSEQQARTQQIKIQQVESSLYGGTVHNPKELQDLQADLVSLKKHLAVIEEQELEAMSKVETATAALQTAHEHLNKVRERLGNAHRKLMVEQESLAHDLLDLQTERQATVNAVAAGMLQIYEDLRQQRRGVAVAEVTDNACGACGTTLTAALQQSARHAAQLVYCPSCGRILYPG